MRTTARFECVAGLQPKQKARETTTRETLYSSLSFRLIIYDVPILFDSPFHHLLRQIVGIEILSVRTVVYEYSCIRPSCKSIVTNLSTFFSYVRTYVLEKFRNRFPSRRDARINILETGRDLIWKFISDPGRVVSSMGLPPPFPFCFEVSFAAELRARYSNGETEKTGHSFIKLFDIASVKEEEEEWRIGGAQRERYWKQSATFDKRERNGNFCGGEEHSLTRFFIELLRPFFENVPIGFPAIIVRWKGLAG